MKKMFLSVLFCVFVLNCNNQNWIAINRQLEAIHEHHIEKLNDFEQEQNEQDVNRVGRIALHAANVLLAS